MHQILTLILAVLSISMTDLAARAVPAEALAIRSTGENVAGGWRLDANGYIGAYLKVETSGEITIRVKASGDASGEVNPQMLVSISDQHQLNEVSRDSRAYESTFDLVPGTYLVRVALVNDTPGQDLALVIESVEVEGAALIEENTDALALAAADTYIQTGRRGNVRIHLPGVEAGTDVRARLTRLDFNLGANVPGTSNIYITEDAEPGSMPYEFQKHFLESFNATVPSNAGKWAYNEAERDVVTMGYVDTILGYAEEHDLWMRMHTLIWNTEQQPDWVHELIGKAQQGDADAKAQLREEITERIGYYVRDRAKRFDAIDVLNEVHHQPVYLEIFGVEGIADIYRETAEAIREGGGEAQTFINEFNILQWSRRPPYVTDDTEPDPYANWYREHAEELQHHGAQLDAIGVQYYANADPTIGSNKHSAARIAQVLHNLSITGLPIALTEFGVSRGAEPEDAAKVLSDTLRLMFGHPSGQTFLMFGFYRGATWERAAEGTLFDTDWSVSEPGKAYQALLDQWSTDESLKVDDDGTVEFIGYYGDYEITIDGHSYPLTIRKGQHEYQIKTRLTPPKNEQQTKKDTPMKRVGIIFDDGPHPEQTEKLLAILAKRQGRVTFGQIAEAAQAHPELVERVVSSGHEIANHSLSHKHPDELDDAALAEQVVAAQRIFEDELGVKPVWYWPPYLARDARLTPAAASVGIDLYDPRNLVDSKDYVREHNADEIVRRATTGVSDGSVILFHEWRAETAERLPEILDVLTEQGCEFLTFSELHRKSQTSE